MHPFTVPLEVDSAQSVSVLAPLLGLILASTLFAATVAAEPTNVERDALRRDLGDVEEWLQTARRKRDSTAEQLRVAELEAAEIQLNIRSLEAQRRSIESTSRQLTQERGALLRSLQEHQGAIVGYLNAAYTLGGGNLVKLVLKQRDPTKIPRMLAYYGYLARARTAALSEARELLNALDAKDQAIEANHTTLLQRKHSLTRAFERLAEAREARASVLSSISLHISMRESDREELSEALVAIERALARVTRERQFDTRTFNTARGQIPWPVEKGSITHRFGSRREGEQRWAGLFIAAPEGTEIRAVHPGQVVFSNWLRGLGLLLILDHGGGFMTLYAHAATIMKRVGEFVSSGEVIATTGDTGGISDSGLYFELRRQGKPTDPTPWLAARN